MAKANEIRVKVHATTVTPAHWKMCKTQSFIDRLMTILVRPQNKILGVEFAGEVEAVGAEVSRFRVGDPVFGYCKSAADTKYLCMAEDGIVAHIPDEISFEQAATFPLGALTALSFMREGQFKPGQKVLIYGASGSVCTFAIQLAKALGAKVTAVTSNHNLELVKSLGADEVIDYTTTDYSVSNQTYDLIFDTVGKTTFSKAEKVLKADGCFVSPGFSPVWMWHMLRNPKNGGQKVIVGAAKATQKDLEFLQGLVESGDIQLAIDRRSALAQIHKVHTYVEGGRKVRA